MAHRTTGDWFDRVATGFGRWMSNPYTFLIVFATILSWTIAGFFLGFAGTWLSGMHMAGPVVTLLIVFLLQHSQAKNTRALQLKLDELIASKEGTRKSTIKAERKTARSMKEMERDPGEANNLQDTHPGAQRRRRGRAAGRDARAAGGRRRRRVVAR